MSVFTVCAMGACADTVLCLAPKETAESVLKYARLVITLCVMCTMLSPLSGCDTDESFGIEAPIENNSTEYSKTNDLQNDKASSSKTLSEIVVDNTESTLENQIASYIYSELGISEAQVRIQLREEITNGNTSLYITQVVVTAHQNDLSPEKTQQISELVRRLTGCQNIQISSNKE